MLDKGGNYEHNVSSVHFSFKQYYTKKILLEHLFILRILSAENKKTKLQIDYYRD